MSAFDSNASRRILRDSVNDLLSLNTQNQPPENPFLVGCQPIQSHGRMRHPARAKETDSRSHWSDCADLPSQCGLRQECAHDVDDTRFDSNVGGTRGGSLVP